MCLKEAIHNRSFLLVIKFSKLKLVIVLVCSFIYLFFLLKKKKDFYEVQQNYETNNLEKKKNTNVSL